MPSRVNSRQVFVSSSLAREGVYLVRYSFPIGLLISTSAAAARIRFIVADASFTKEISPRYQTGSAVFVDGADEGQSPTPSGISMRSISRSMVAWSTSGGPGCRGRSARRSGPNQTQQAGGAQIDAQAAEEIWLCPRQARHG